MKKYSIYEPYGYQDGINYISKKEQIERELSINRMNDCKEFASVEYNETLQALIFRNVKGEERGCAYLPKESGGTGITVDAYTKQEADDRFQVKGNYASMSELQAVNDKLDAIDLTPYATINDVNTALELKANKTEIPNDFYSQEEVNRMMSQLLTRIENLEENNGVIVADSAESVQEATSGSNLVLTSTEALQALTSNTEYNTITIIGGNANNGDIKVIASDKLTIDGMTVSGSKGQSNGRILISANNVTIKNSQIESSTTAYNIFESSQDTANTEYFTNEYSISNMMVDDIGLKHNVANIYTFNDNAVVNVKDSYFNIDADNTNVLRLSNYTNATGVTVNFENVNWTYENAETNDWTWAGLIIYQPAGNDVALNGDTSKLETWKFNFKNCKYNGEIVSSVNFGQHNQVIYGYNINKDGNISDISSILTITFE